MAILPVSGCSLLLKISGHDCACESHGQACPREPGRMLERIERRTHCESYRSQDCLVICGHRLWAGAVVAAAVSPRVPVVSKRSVGGNAYDGWSAGTVVAFSPHLIVKSRL